MHKKPKRTLSAVLVLTMVLSLCTVGAFAADAAELTIVSVTTDNTTSTSAMTHVTAVTYTENGESKTVSAPEGQVLTFVVNGAQEDIKAGASFTGLFSFTATPVLKSGAGAPPWDGPTATKAEYNFRQALLIGANGVNAEASVTDAISGSYDGASAKDVTVNSNGAFFNGIYVTDSAEYAIDGLNMTMVGDGGDDFSGWGAGVMADGTSKLTINHAIIDTYGVIRTAIWAGGDADLHVTNSVISANETLDTKEEYDALVVSMMKRTPFALGMEGVVRATNVLGSATALYEDSIVVSTGWGALSTDSGVGHDTTGEYALTAKNVLGGIGTVEVAQAGKEYTLKKTVNGVEYGFTMAGSGYVAYADSGVWDLFDNVQFYTPDYVQIMASSTSSAYYTNSDLHSGRIAFMTQQNAGGLLSVKDSTVYAEDTLVQIKSGAANKGYTNVEIDNVDVTLGVKNPWGGTLIELVESDDAGNPGVTTYTINDNGDTATRATSKGEINDSNATLKNGDYTGNIWNNIYNYTQALNVTLDNATVTGSISASYGYHTDGEGNRLANGSVLNACTWPNYLDPVNGTNGDYLKIGAQFNVANEVVNNPVNLTLTNGSVWNVVGEANHMANVTVDSLDDIKSGTRTTVYAQSLTVDGEAKADGTYEHGNVTYIVEAAPVIDTNSDILAETQDYSGLHAVTFKAVTEDGAPASAAVAFDYKAFTYITFEANAKDGWEIVSVECSDTSVLTHEEDGSYRLDGLTQAENTVTITVKEAPQQGGMPGEPQRPEQPTEPAQPEQSTEPAQPEQADQPGEPVQPEQSEQPTEPVQPEQPAPEAVTYVVKRGDTLSGIAKAYYGYAAMWKAIYEYNKAVIKNASLIYAGQTILLPNVSMNGSAGATPPASSETPADDTTYTVKSGDSLSSIAETYYGDARLWKTIYEANKSIIKNANVIYPGQVLTIPAK